MNIRRVNPIMSLTPKPKQQSYDDDPWRVISTPSSFPDYQNTTGDKFESDSVDNQGENSSANNNQTIGKVDGGTQQITENGGKSTAASSSVANSAPISRTVTVEPVVADKVSTQALVKSSTESYQWFLDLDQITVSIAEKEGFLFTHVNYWVHSNQRQTSVRRRYSDFYWFWETLLKRYPFRVIPNLPPKKLSGSNVE